jgi:hypothetical protein
MDTIGIDLHKRESQLCIIGEDGAVTERRIVTSRELKLSCEGVNGKISKDSIAMSTGATPA